MNKKNTVILFSLALIILLSSCSANNIDKKYQSFSETQGISSDGHLEMIFGPEYAVIKTFQNDEEHIYSLPASEDYDVLTQLNPEEITAVLDCSAKTQSDFITWISSLNSCNKLYIQGITSDTNLTFNSETLSELHFVSSVCSNLESANINKLYLTGCTDINQIEFSKMENLEYLSVTFCSGVTCLKDLKVPESLDTLWICSDLAYTTYTGDWPVVINDETEKIPDGLSLAYSNEDILKFVASSKVTVYIGCQENTWP